MKSLLFGMVVLTVVSVAATQSGIPCPAVVNAQCPAIDGGQAVFFAHPNDCSKYCQCVDLGLAYEMVCAPGLLWDDIKNTCNWPNYVSTVPASFIFPPSL